MLHIGIDCRFGGTFSGLGSYTRALVTNLLQRRDPIQYTLFVRSVDEEWIRGLVGSPTDYRLPIRPELTAEWQTTDFPQYSLAEQVLFPLALRRSGIDLFFSLHFNVPFFCPVPFVATIHDLILHQYPNEAPLWKRMGYRSVMHHTVIRARALIAVSQFVAEEIRKTYGQDAASTVTVVREGVDARFFRCSVSEQEGVRRKYHLHTPFFLYVGNAKEHKNVRMLIAAFGHLHSSEKMLVLVMSGREADALELGRGIRRLSSVPEEDLPALYSAAEAFVTASLYEGFCLPLAEARACGCPIIAFRTGAIPEIGGEGVVLVDATMEALIAVLEAPPSRAGTSWQRGWEAVAEETVHHLLMVQ